MKSLWTIIFTFSLIFISCEQKAYQNKNLSVDARVEDLLKRMTLEEKIDMIGGYEGFNIKPLDRLDIPKIRMADGPVGVRNYGKSTAYPSSLGLAASWNIQLAKSVGASIGKEAKSKNVHIMLGPAMNIHRGPMCGRNFEYLGEDPFLAGEIASNYIIGLQNEGVMATAKHYVANYQDFDRHNVSSDMDERTLREIYLPAFKKSVLKGRVAAVMTAYNLVNGVHSSQDSFMNNSILKSEWGFDGFIMSDWTSTYESVGAANGGLDLEMPYAKYMNIQSLVPAIHEGQVKEETIDDKVRRMLRKIIEFGHFDDPDIAAKAAIDREACSQVALEAAREGIVLLKNSGLLPFDKKKIRSIAVLGPNATRAVTGGGGSSYVVPIQSTSLLEGIKSLVGDAVEVFYSAGPFDQVADDFFRKNNHFYVSTENENRPGLKAEIFANMALENEPAVTRIDKVIDFSFGKYIAEDIVCQQVSARWTGKINPQETGQYKFVLSGDDGYRLFVDNELVIEEWKDQAEKSTSRILSLEAGTEYEIRLEYYQNGGGASFRFGYEKYSPSSANTAYEYASKADIVVIGVGFTKDTEGEGSDRTFALPEGQEAFLNKVLALNENSVVILNAGGNVDMTSWLPQTKALLHAFYPGQEGGKAIAELLFGETNPSAKLPVSFESKWADNATADSYFDSDGDKKVFFSEGIYLGYRYFDTKNVAPLFPFGFGLSYTHFEYSDMKTVKAGEGSFKITFNIENKGKVFGKEIAQVYVSDLESSIDRPLKELKGFAKISLAPGQKSQLEITLPKEAFSFFDPVEKRWKMEQGEFLILIGASSRDIRLSEKVSI